MFTWCPERAESKLQTPTRRGLMRRIGLGERGQFQLAALCAASISFAAAGLSMPRSM